MPWLTRVCCSARALLVGIRLDQAGFDREALAPDQTLLDAAFYGGLDQLAREVAVAEAAMPVLREGKRQREIFLPKDDRGAYLGPLRVKEQQSLIRAVAQARSWLREIIGGATIAAIASRENKSDRAVRMDLSLAFLDPKLVKAVMQGTLPRGVSARRLVDAPTTWTAQWQTIGLSRPA